MRKILHYISTVLGTCPIEVKYSSYLYLAILSPRDWGSLSRFQRPVERHVLAVLHPPPEGVRQVLHVHRAVRVEAGMVVRSQVWRSREAFLSEFRNLNLGDAPRIGLKLPNSDGLSQEQKELLLENLEIFIHNRGHFAFYKYLCNLLPKT